MDVGTIEAALKLRAEYQQTLKQFRKDFGDSIQDIASDIREIGKVASIATAAIGLGLGKATKDAISFEDAFVGVRKTVDAAPAELDALFQEFKKLSTEIPVTVEELSKIGETAGQLGIAKEDVLDFTKTIAAVGVTTNLTAEEAATGFAQLQNIMGQVGKDTDKLASTIVDLGNKGASTEKAIVDMALRIAGAGVQVGLTQDQVVGFGAALANVGIRAEAGGTALTKTINDISVAVDTGGEKLAGFAEVAGLSAEQFATKFRGDAAGAITDFIVGLDRMREAGGNVTIALQELGITEVRQADAIKRLSADSDKLVQTLKDAAEAWRQNTALVDESEKFYATTGNQIKVFLNQLRLVGVELAGAFLPFLRAAIEALGPLIDLLRQAAQWFAALPPSIRLVGGALVLVTGAIGPLLYAFGSLMSTMLVFNATILPVMVSSWITLANTLPAIAVRLWALNVAQAAVNATTGQGVIVTEALVAAQAKAFLGLGARLGGVVTVAAAAAYGLKELLASVEGAAEGFANSANPIEALIGKWAIHTRESRRAAEALEELTAAQDAYNHAVVNAPTLPRNEAPDIQKQMAEFRRVATEALTPTRDFVAELKNLDAAVQAVPPRIREQIIAAKQLGADTEKVAEHFGVAEAVVEKLAKTTKEAAKSTREAAEEFRKATEALSGQKAIDDAEKLVKSIQAIGSVKLIDPAQLASVRDALEDAVASVDRLGSAAPASARASADAWRSMLEAVKPLAQAWQENEDAIRGIPTMVKDAVSQVDADIQTLYQSQLKLNAAIRDADTALSIRKGFSGYSKELQDLAKKTAAFEKEIDDIREEARDADPALRELYDRLIELNEANFAEEFEEASKEIPELRAAIVGLLPLFPQLIGYLGKLDDLSKDSSTKGKKATDEWTTSLKDLARAFADLSETGGGLGGFAKAAGEIVSAASLANEAFKSVKAGIADLADSTKGSLANAFSDIAGGLVSGVGALVGATDPTKSLTSRVLGGALSGAQLGSSIGAAAGAGFAVAFGSTVAKGAAVGGVWGAAAGAVIGVFIAVFRGRAARREMEIVGKEWGQSISKGLQESIDSNKETMFGPNGRFGRVEATTFLLSEFIKEAGGINDLNFDKFTGKLRDVFVMIETGGFTVEQATHVIDENFSTLASHLVESGKLATQGFQEILRLNREFGVFSEEVKTFVTQRLGEVGAGVAALGAPLFEKVGTLAAALQRVNDEIAKMAKDGRQGTDDYAAAVAEANRLEEERAHLASASADELERLGVIALAGFNAARQSGVDMFTAMQQLSPTLDQLILSYQTLGIDASNAAIGPLIHWRNLVNENQSLVVSASALDQVMLALSHTGGLTKDALLALEVQGVQTFNKLIAAGFTEEQALAQMANFLKLVIQRHEELGIPIDDNIGKLIDMADGYGLLESNGESMVEVLKGGFKSVVESINALIKAMGGVAPEVQKVKTEIDKIPKEIEFDVRFNVGDLELPSGSINVPAAAEGGIAMKPTIGLWGEKEPEALIPLSKLDQYGGGGGGPRVQYITVQVDSDPIIQKVIRGMPGEVTLYGA